MSEQTRFFLRRNSTKEPKLGRNEDAENLRLAKALEGTVSLEDYRALLIKAYHDLHKNENV